MSADDDRAAARAVVGVVAHVMVKEDKGNRSSPGGTGNAETNPALGVKPQLVGQQASTGEIYAPYDEDIVQMARSFM